MTTEVKIHITEDDLSETIKAKIKRLREQGIDVELIWPENYGNLDKYSKWPYITPAPVPINPLQQDPIFPYQIPTTPWRAPDIYCTTTCILN